MPAPPALHASPHARRETSTLRQTQTRALQQQARTAATASHLISSQPSDQPPRPLHWLELVPAIALQLDDAGSSACGLGVRREIRFVLREGEGGGRGRVGAIGGWFRKGGTGMGWMDGWMDG
jgi:hypothetical protein